MISAALTGYFTALSLILAIGAQNAFVLRQGLIGQHVFALCLFNAISDALLIFAGVLGFGWLVNLNPHFPDIMAAAGACFLIVYGGFRFVAAFKGASHLDAAGETGNLSKILLTTAALTWLNPHVYLDTLGLIGAVSTKFEGLSLKLAFASAAALGSFSFFFALGYGARLISPFMQSSRAWQVLDVLIGAVMWAIAGGLIVTLF